MYTYRKNLQGDITGIYNQNGTLVVEYVYDAYGNVVSKTGSAASTIGSMNPFLYRGYYYDYDLGWYYLNSRYYDSVVGRFINADAQLNTSLGILGANLFAYCLDNPVNMVDVEGEKPKYITYQGDDEKIGKKKMKDISFGLGNIADNGCGVIAAYNVVLSVKSKTKFRDVKKGIIRKGGLLLGGGLAGTTPNAIKRYLRTKFWFVISAGPIQKLWGIKAELSDSVVVLLKWEDTLAMHYVAGIGTGNDWYGGSFEFYNSGLDDEYGNSIDGIAMSIWNFIDYAELNGATPLYLIGVANEK